MMPGMNPRQMQKMMKKMGISQTEIPATEVIIKGETDYVIRNPNVLKVNMQGQETLQITGDLEEMDSISEEDVKTVSEQAEVSLEEARKALEKNQGDLASAILFLTKNK
ncbi:MAG: nascent polypeptide-associated complex protein [Nanoarchaeota archaeon]|nr:nascent polypeptide-associated complex protein [Nanoarchaeota archaeon]MBU1445201.1 nascent polypeptide-associated complex protein [Nanoarchaeota archaeon]MBU2406759.1 nascent polypeptide-associated complex protein [Nanoarchaeota archaeon]MBU2420285.1 nascent polypeptide-associated complex protein [Nanoarchaeota archaeon]MBU2475319.1 nascent polypeptide-associated complex protein [Nanoarchaeota archaeon]